MLSRWGYTDAADVQDKWHQFRDRQIPVDAFIYDYDWFVNDWEFNPKTFPPGSLDTDEPDGPALRRHPQAARQRREPGLRPQPGLGPEQPVRHRPAL